MDPDVDSMTIRQVYNYSRDILGGRFEIGEPILAKDAEFATYYAMFVIKERFYEAEHTIAQNPYYARYYASRLHFRFHEAEPNIAKDPKEAFLYAMDVLGEPWNEANETIMNSPYAMRYKEFVFKMNMEELGLPP